MKTAHDENRIHYLMRVKDEIERLLSNDNKFHALYSVFTMGMSSVHQLTAMKNYISYKIVYVENQKHHNTHELIHKIVEVICNERVAEIVPNKRKYTELVTDTNVVKTAKNWF